MSSMRSVRQERESRDPITVVFLKQNTKRVTNLVVAVIIRVLLRGNGSKRARLGFLVIDMIVLNYILHVFCK